MKFIKKLIGILATTVVVLFVVYFWNLDGKVTAWLYQRVNEIFDRKKVNQVF